jgi:hypothetical protein
MKRASIFVAVALLVAACETSPSAQPDQSQPAGQSQAPGASQAPSAGGGGGGGGGDGAALAEAANAVTDWCALMPADLVEELVPEAGDPQPLEFPIGCAISNGVQVVQVTYQSSSGAEPGPGATSVPGLGESAWLEPTGIVDDAYLIAILYTDPGGLGASTLYVEVAGHDGVDHADDVIAVAEAVIEELN